MTTPNRIKLLCALQTVDRSLRTGLQIDTTGGIVRQGSTEARGLDFSMRCAAFALLTPLEQFLHVSLVYQLPEAAGGGRVILAVLVTDSRAEGAMVAFLECVNRAAYKEGASRCLVRLVTRCDAKHRAGTKLLPPHCTSDQDDATLNAVCRAWNRMSFDETLREIVKRLRELAQRLLDLGLLGVVLDEDNPPPVGLPIPGFQLNAGESTCGVSAIALRADAHGADGSVVPLLMHDITIPLLCYAHFIKTAIDYVAFTSVYFKHVGRNGALLSTLVAAWLHACVFRRAVRQQGAPWRCRLL